MRVLEFTPALSDPVEAKRSSRPRISAKNPRGGIKFDRGGYRGGLKPHAFETTGEYRLWTAGKPGPWLRGPAEKGSDERTY